MIQWFAALLELLIKDEVAKKNHRRTIKNDECITHSDTARVCVCLSGSSVWQCNVRVCGESGSVPHPGCSSSAGRR